MKRRNLSFLIKIFVLVAIVAIAATIYISCTGGIQKIDNTYPDVTMAPYQVLTKTKTFYAQQAYKNDDQSVTMLRWYEKIDDKWIYHTDTITIPIVLRPHISNR